MLISKAYAQAVDIGTQVGVATPPSAGEAFAWNMGMVLVLVALFYVLLIRPQQKRFREHSEMLQGLNKGDAIVTGGGLVGTISKIEAGKDEVEIDLGNGLKVKAMRSSLQAKAVPQLKGKIANDQSGNKKDAKKK